MKCLSRPDTCIEAQHRRTMPIRYPAPPILKIPYFEVLSWSFSPLPLLDSTSRLPSPARADKYTGTQGLHQLDAWCECSQQPFLPLCTAGLVPPTLRQYHVCLLRALQGSIDRPTGFWTWRSWTVKRRAEKRGLADVVRRAGGGTTYVNDGSTGRSRRSMGMRIATIGIQTGSCFLLQFVSLVFTTALRCDSGHDPPLGIELPLLAARHSSGQCRPLHNTTCPTSAKPPSHTTPKTSASASARTPLPEQKNCAILQTTDSCALMAR